MTVPEIRQIAINSAEVYYRYLADNNKGIQRVDVHEIEYLRGSDLILQLKLAAKLFDIEAISFENLSAPRPKYDTNMVRVLEYDNDNNVLIIKPAEQYRNEFRNLRNTDLKVISDLKFLVERVKSWYELNGTNISLPSTTSPYANNVKSIKFLDNESFHPSINQIESIKNIFNNPFSYIWGAPGTGKTQFVLSYAVLHYIRNKGRIAILAPTNNAIEQVLRGVIKMTDIEGVKRDKILRLGTPTKKFAEEFPEVCEARGLQKKLEEIDKQINIVIRIINYEQSKNLSERVKEILPLFDKIPEHIKAYDDAGNKLNYLAGALQQKEKENKTLRNRYSGLKKKLEAQQAKVNSPLNKLAKLFTSGTTKREQQLIGINHSIQRLKNEFESLKKEYTEIQQNHKYASKHREKTSARLTGILQKIIEPFEHTEVETIVNKLNKSNYITVKEQIINAVNTIQEKASIEKALHEIYKDYSLLMLNNKVEKLRADREKLEMYSTEERLKNVQIIASTLDGYIGKFVDSKLEVDHIFVDEAGYANIIKALTLFNQNVPVCFLGDHMQLPPVSEINDDKIREQENYRNVFLWSQSAIYLDNLFFTDRDTCVNQYLSNNSFTPNVLSKTTLSTTYRFGNNLAEILGKYAYENNFYSSTMLGETQILFIDAPKNTEPVKRTSKSEAIAIQELVNELRNDGNKDFVILTPYRNQVNLLNYHMPRERNELKILTVHKGQGQEWDTVILSVVDTYDMFFTDTTNRQSKGLNLINTAISRAKHKLIIVCDKNYWINQPGQLIYELLRCGKEIQAHSLVF